jgi:hypothetical protein
MVNTHNTPTKYWKLFRGLWWAAFVASVLLLLASLPGYGLFLRGQDLSSGFENLQRTVSWVNIFLSIGAAMLCLLQALLVFLKRPGEPMAMFLSFFLLIYGTLMVGPIEQFIQYYLPPQSAELALQLHGVLISILFQNLLLALMLIFPNGHFRPRWTVWLLVTTLLMTLVELLVFSIEDWQLSFTGPRGQVGYAILAVIFLISFGVQIYRYRRTYNRAERQQTKWVLSGLVGFIILVLCASLPYYYLLSLPPGTPDPWWGPITGFGWFLSLILLPVTLTIAILRYRLFDIDLLIRRTLVYGALTATLALIYFGSVLVLQWLFQTLTGRSQSPIVIVISTLAIAALFNPLRKRIQNDIDRRFYRRRYDADQMLEAFAEQLRHEVNLEQISRSLLGVASESMQPERVSLWLKDE